MCSDIIDLCQTILRKGFPVLFSFLDDALLLGLTQMGVNLPWLQWLSLVLLSAAVLYWSFCIARLLSQRYRVN